MHSNGVFDWDALVAGETGAAHTTNLVNAHEVTNIQVDAQNQGAVNAVLDIMFGPASPTESSSSDDQDTESDGGDWMWVCRSEIYRHWSGSDWLMLFTNATSGIAVSLVADETNHHNVTSFDSTDMTMTPADSQHLLWHDQTDDFAESFRFFDTLDAMESY